MRFSGFLALLVSAPLFAQEELLKTLKWRNIGPANMMGRVADVEGVPGVPEIVYVGSASGGVWKTSNAGVTWAPLFDEMDYLSIGDMALEPGNPDVVYVGTGEGNPRNSVSFGNGIYKTTDGGKSWKSPRARRQRAHHPHPRRSEEFFDRIRRRSRPHLRAQRGAGYLREPRLRRDLGKIALHRRPPRSGRPRHRPGEPEPSLRRDVVLRIESPGPTGAEARKAGSSSPLTAAGPGRRSRRAFRSSWAASDQGRAQRSEARCTSSPRPMREVSTGRTTTARASRRCTRIPAS